MNNPYAKHSSISEQMIDHSLWEVTVLLSEAHGLTKALELLLGDRLEHHASCSVVDVLLKKMILLEKKHQTLCEFIHK